MQSLRGEFGNIRVMQGDALHPLKKNFAVEDGQQPEVLRRDTRLLRYTLPADTLGQQRIKFCNMMYHALFRDLHGVFTGRLKVHLQPTRAQIELHPVAVLLKHMTSRPFGAENHAVIVNQMRQDLREHLLRRVHRDGSLGFGDGHLGLLLRQRKARHTRVVPRLRLTSYGPASR